MPYTTDKIQSVCLYNTVSGIEYIICTLLVDPDDLFDSALAWDSPVPSSIGPVGCFTVFALLKIVPIFRASIAAYGTVHYKKPLVYDKSREYY